MIPAAASTCPSCGIRRSILANAAPVAPAPPPLAQAAYTPSPQPIGVRLAHGGADACPHCFAYLFSNKYSWVHVLVSIFWFPLGLLILFAPIKRCQCGYEYGAGKLIETICMWLLIVSFAIFIIVLAVISRAAAQL
jgi:hypothetical protein